jgi:hypothetical protein
MVGDEEQRSLARYIFLTLDASVAGKPFQRPCASRPEPRLANNRVVSQDLTR